MSKYRTVKSLPDDAVKVSVYAKEQGISASNVYWSFLNSKKRAFEMVADQTGKIMRLH